MTSLNPFIVNSETFDFALDSFKSGGLTFVDPFSGKEVSGFDSLFPFDSVSVTGRHSLSDSGVRILEVGRGDRYCSDLFTSKDPGYVTRIKNLSLIPGELPVLYGVQFKNGEEVWICEKPGEVRKIYSTRS